MTKANLKTATTKQQPYLCFICSRQLFNKFCFRKNLKEFFNSKGIRNIIEQLPLEIYSNPPQQQ